MTEPVIDIERLAAILRSRIVGGVHWRDDEGDQSWLVTDANEDRAAGNGLAVRIAHLYETGDVLSELPPRERS